MKKKVLIIPAPEKEKQDCNTCDFKECCEIQSYEHCGKEENEE